MTKQHSTLRSKQRVRADAQQRARGRIYNLLFVAVSLAFMAYIGFRLLSPLRFNGVTDSQSSDTDIASLRAAETGQLGEVALVWFHADW